ncbi:hypothetical protein [Yersinia aldovae]|uniref:hypothetical protein n=1 Tax=Yersinia aldovae TaxID=29483 RepID=UPI003CC632C1
MLFEDILFELQLTNYCWKRDQSNTLPIDRKAIPTIVTSMYTLLTWRLACICYNSGFIMLLPVLFMWLSH